MRGIIYKYTSRTTGKVYIGQTVNETKRRSAHKHMKTDWQSHFYNAIAKYGYEDFDYEVIYEVISDIPGYVKQVLDMMEVYYIQKYNSTNPKFGYNIAAGGGGTVGVPCSEEHKRKISKIMKDKHIKLNENQLNALRNMKHAPTHAGKAVEQFSPEGVLIAEFDSYKRAAESIGGDPPSLIKAMKRVNNTGWYKGYFWKLKTDPMPFNFVKPTHHSAIAIKQYSRRAGELIKIWNSYVDISLFYGNTKAAAHAGIVNNPNGYKGYRWEAVSHP